jgi:aerobic carbon-monoxide dehydrogenase medium subunit
MKPAPFELLRPPTLGVAVAMLAGAGAEARVLSGGQSLGPMLNLRVVQPRVLVQINHLPALAGVAETAEAIVLGACVTHAAIAAGRTPDLGDGWLARIAGAIAYQAVRNRGTIGGSLCHADPAADWVIVLTALDASVVLQSTAGIRRMRLHDFVAGPYATRLAAGEILAAVNIPQRSAGATWRYAKACRKPGEFAHAMGALLLAGTTRRLVIGALGTRPLLLTGEQVSLDGADAALAGLDAVDRHMQLTVVRRLLQDADACAA